MSPEERKQKGRSGTTASSMGKGKKAQWSKRAAPKGNGNVHGRVDYTQRSGDIYGVQRIRLQGNEDREEQRTGRYSCAIYGVEVAKRHGIREIKKQNVEGQKR